MSQDKVIPSNFYDYFDFLGQGNKKKKQIQDNKEKICCDIQNKPVPASPICHEKICEL